MGVLRICIYLCTVVLFRLNENGNSIVSQNHYL